jgi:hypothetical protein
MTVFSHSNMRQFFGAEFIASLKDAHLAADKKEGLTRSFSRFLEDLDGSYKTQYNQAVRAKQKLDVEIVKPAAFRNFLSAVFNKYLDDDKAADIERKFRRYWEFEAALREQKTIDVGAADRFESMTNGASLDYYRKDRRAIVKLGKSQIIGLMEQNLTQDAVDNARYLISFVLQKRSDFALHGDFELGCVLSCLSFYGGCAAAELHDRVQLQRFVELSAKSAVHGTKNCRSARAQFTYIASLGFKLRPTKNPLELNYELAELRLESDKGWHKTFERDGFYGSEGIASVLYAERARIQTSVLELECQRLTETEFADLVKEDSGLGLDYRPMLINDLDYRVPLISKDREARRSICILIALASCELTYVEGDIQQAIKYLCMALEKLESARIRTNTTWCDWYSMCSRAMLKSGNAMAAGFALQRVLELQVSMGNFRGEQNVNAAIDQAESVVTTQNSKVKSIDESQLSRFLRQSAPSLPSLAKRK